MRLTAEEMALVGCMALVANGCRADVFLNAPEGGSADGSQNGPIIPVDGASICVTGQCTCTVDNQCIRDCGTQPATTISGTVYDPAGNNPLYDIAVYVPVDLSLPDLPGPPGALVTCPSCPDYYPKAVVSGQLTDTKGRFQIHVPVGDHVPLVVQIGKWRHLTSVSTKPCQDNPILDGTLRLPSQGGNGDTLPQFAISTGSADSMECLLKRIGVADSEYTNGPGGTGHIHIFQGGGGMTAGGPQMPGGSPHSPNALWPSGDELRKYDVVILSCEAAETTGVNPAALQQYADIGGRVFASHFHYAWFTTNSAFVNLASWSTGTQDIGNINALIQTGFYGGMQMHDWLKNVGALTNDELPVVQARYNALVAASNMNSTAWIAADQDAGLSEGGSAAGATEYFSFETPLAAPIEHKCGRVVYSDLHVGAASSDYGVMPGGVTSGGIVPSGCVSALLSPQEKALEYMLFDLTACFTLSHTMPMSDWPK